MPRTHRIDPRPPRRAFTLVEVTISLLVVSLVLVSALYSLGAAARSTRLAAHDDQGLHLARQLLGEIVQGHYEEPDADPAFGREFESGANRDGWDDVDDYQGWSASPPERKDGTAMTEFAGWTRAVDVVFADPGTLAPAGTATDTGLKRVQVTVTAPEGTVTVQEAVRSRSSVYEQSPALDTEMLTWVGLELRASGDAETVATGVALRNPISQGMATGE